MILQEGYQEDIMKKKIIIVSVIIISVTLIALKFIPKKDISTSYGFTEIERGDIINTVSSTGELNPVSTVDVGTQVSGIIDNVLVDFNDNVVKGQLLAVIDTFVLATQLTDAKAAADRAKAQYDLAVLEHDNNVALFNKEMIAKYTLDKSETNMRSTKASWITAEAALKRAKRNLSYAMIKSPINGKVIHRNVEIGQTVAASYSTPTLFTIAEDLSKMEMLAVIDESDIGLIKEGINVTFEVPAYTDRTFSGRVSQIRLQPEIVSNVVMYTAVIQADNSDGALMPGMTATVDFLLDEARDVLMVSNSALSFKPNPEMMEQFRASRKDRTRKNRTEGTDKSEQPHYHDDRKTPDSLVTMDANLSNSRDTLQNNAPSERMDKMPENAALLWYLDDNGVVSAIPVIKGVTDGKNCQVSAMHGDLHEGMKIINKINDSKGSNQKDSTQKSNIFMQQGPGGMGGRRP